MPPLKTHCENSKKRTGKEFEDLHRWMDEGAKYLGQDHRFERHSGAYLGYVKEKWGKEGVIEFLNHIIDDFTDTLKKFTGTCVYCEGATWQGKPICNKCYRDGKRLPQDN